MRDRKMIKILIGILILLIIIVLYRFSLSNIETCLMNGRNLAIYGSIGVFVLSLIITLIRSYKQ